MPQLWVVPEELEEGAGSPYAYEACKVASYVLWAFSGRKYHGTRTVTERYEFPCRRMRTSEIRPYMIGNGEVYNGLLPDLLDKSCDCAGVIGGRHTRLRLRGTPVRNVAKVVQGENVLDPSEYKIVNGSILQLTGSTRDVRNLTVTYTYGMNVPMAGQRAARGLARELVKGWSGKECMLPDRVTSVQREGISFTVIDPQDFIDDGRTGIYEADLFLRAVNPDKARKPAKVFSPDRPRAFRVTAGEADQIVGPYDWSVVPGTEATWQIDLPSADADILLDESWNPQGQITSWNGSTLLEFDPARFDITGNTLTVTLTPEETAQISGSKALWDLYGISTADGYTVIHVLSSEIYTSGA